MALFKIFKGSAANLGASGNPTEIAQEGFAYFTPDDGKFYIDIENANEAVIGENRIPINAYLADKFSSDKLITLTGDVTGTDAKDGETGWSIATTLRNSGVISGLYGPEGNEVTNGAVVIPRLTINEKGLITGAESVEVRISGIADTKVTQDLEANNGEYFPLFTPKNQGATANTTATFNRYVKVNPYISEWTFLSNNGDSHHDTPSFILSRSNNGANLKLWGQSGDFYISSDYWVNSKKTTFSEHLIKLSPANASITFQGHLLPNSSGWALGSVLAPWEAGFFNQGLMIGGNLNYGSSSIPIYWNNGIPTPITSYEGTAARAISDDDGNNIKNTYASNLTFTNGLLILKNKNGIALDTITLDTLTVSDITTGTEDVRKLITAKVFKDSVDSLISQLNVNEKTFANGEVLKTLKEENGKIGLTTGQLSIDGGILAGSYVINLKEDNSSFSQFSIGQMQGATATTPGAVGLVPQTVAGDQEKFLRGDGQWIIPTNTDYQVRQTNTGADKDYRVLLSYSDTNNEETNTVYKHSGLLYNPSSNTLTVTYIEGRAATAGRANADSLGNVINTTYALKTATVSNVEWNSTNKKLVKTINGTESDVINFVAGDNITFTSDNTSLTIAAADTDTTYSLSGSRSAVNYTMLLTPSSGSATQAVIPTMTPATADAGGLLGLVPNSAPGDQNKFLRADGTWVVPTNTNNKVQSVKTDSTDANYKILFSYTDTNSNETNYVRKDSDFYYNPSSNTLTVTQVAGNAQTASKANADSAGNIIINTYAKKSEALTSITWDKTNKKLIKTINGIDSDILEFIAGNNVTLTADDNKITITTANDNTTYGLSGALTGNTFVTTLTAGGTGVQSTVPAMSAASASAAGKAGLVPAPKKGDQNKFLTGAGTWVEQTVYTLPLASSSTRGGIKIGFESNPNTKNYALLLDDEKAYVNVPWTDRSVEGPGYHYVPQEDSASLLSVSASGGTAEWGINVVQGVKIRRDNRGHITGLEVISGKIPDQPTYPNDRDPGYGSITIDTASTAVNVPTAKKNTATITAATYSERLTLSPTNKWIVMGAADNSSTGLDKIYIGHNISSVTKGSYGPSDNVTASNGGTFSVPYISVDEAGHITGASTKTITLPTSSDTKVTQYNFTQNSDLRIILSNSATGNEETATVNKSNNLTYNPSTNILNTGNLVLSDDLSVGGDVDITGTLDVTGDVTFIKTPNAPTAAAGSNDTKLATTAFVTSAINGLVGPMRFIGTLGTGGTATALASASASNKGYTYKVITAGTYQGAAVKVGDLVISNGSSWVVVPSGDEPSGTVTNIATGNGLTGGPITSTGTISHADTSSQASLTAQSKKYVNAISLDDFGHVTSIGTGEIEDVDTKNTAGATDTNSKIYLIGATEQTVNPQTYSDDEVFVTSGALTAKEFIGAGNNITLNTANRLVYTDVNKKLAVTNIYADENTIRFLTTADTRLLENQYNSINYSLIRNHNNGNISISASSGGLYLGYENTQFTSISNRVKIYPVHTFKESTAISEPGWIRIASLQLNDNNHFGQAVLDFTITRSYNSLAPETYTIRVTAGWQTCTITQIGGSINKQRLSEFRVVVDDAIHKAYFEIYLNTTPSNNTIYISTIDYTNKTTLEFLSEPEIKLDSELTLYKAIKLKTAAISSNKSLYISDVKQGLFLTDSSKSLYGAVYNNNDNLWIGATGTNENIHTGKLYLHAGKDTNGIINKSVYIGIQGDTNTTTINKPIAYGTGGSNIKPVYINNDGLVIPIDYTIEKSVPNNALFTDTWVALSTSVAGYVPKAPNDVHKFLRGDATWADITSAKSTTLDWDTESTIATVGGYDIKVKLPANPNTNTDILVKQTAKSDAVEYKILAGANSNPTSGTAYEAIYDTEITLNPNTNTITATTFKGNASSADIWKTNRKFTIGYKEQNVNGSSDIAWDLHDILKSPTNINKTSDWDIYTPGVYYVASSGAFEGNNHPGTNQNPPYAYGQMIITKANTGGIAQFYISDYASESMNTARGIRYRSGWNNNYHSWATILDDKNYNLYAVKKVTSTDNAIARFDGTTGNIQNSQVTIDDDGIIHVKANQYTDSYSGSLDMKNSNIYGLNSIYTSDSSENASEGIHFYRDATHVDTLWINGGDLLFVPNRELGTGTTKTNSQKVGRFTTNPTTGQVIITDGTTGGMKSSGYTIAANISEGVANQVAYYSATGTISSRAPAWEAWTTGTTTGPKANINIANATITSAAIPSASATASGVVITGAQEFQGLKTIRYTEGNYHNNTGGLNNKFYKIKINSTTSWMLTFTIRVYHNYNWNDIVISGYNYPNDSTHYNWYSAKAVMLGGNHNNEVNVYFGKDANNSLWVGLQAYSYTGLDIFQVTNGYTQITDIAELFTITLVDSLEGEQINNSPIKVKRPAHKGETITYTPAGTNEKSEVTISPITTNIYSMTSAGSVTAGTTPTLTMSVDDSTETLSFTWDAGTSTAVTLPGRSSAIAAWTGYTTGVDNTYAAAQEFTGTQATITI